MNFSGEQFPGLQGQDGWSSFIFREEPKASVLVLLTPWFFSWEFEQSHLLGAWCSLSSVVTHELLLWLMLLFKTVIFLHLLHLPISLPLGCWPSWTPRSVSVGGWVEGAAVLCSFPFETTIQILSLCSRYLCHCPGLLCESWFRPWGSHPSQNEGVLPLQSISSLKACVCTGVSIFRVAGDLGAQCCHSVEPPWPSFPSLQLNHPKLLRSALSLIWAGKASPKGGNRFGSMKDGPLGSWFSKSGPD